MEKKILENVNDADALFLAFSENRVRRDFSPLEEARAFQSMKTALKMLPDDIALKVGRSESYVRERLNLLDLSKPIQKMMMDGDVPYSFAGVLKKLEREPKAQLSFAKQIAENMKPVKQSDYGYDSDKIRTVEDAEKQVARYFANKKHHAEFIAKAGVCQKCGSSDIQGESYQKDKVVCGKCKYEWNAETKEPWELYELKVAAKNLGLDLRVEGNMAIVAAAVEQKRNEEDMNVHPNFRTKATVDELLAPLILKRGVMSVRVDGDQINVTMIQDTGMKFSARKHDYESGERTQVKVGSYYESNGGDENKKKAQVQRVRDYINSLIGAG